VEKVFNEELPEPFQEEDPISFNVAERDDLTVGRSSLDNSQDRIISSLNNSSERVIALNELRNKN
jgi:hypothetical protein